MSRSSAPPGSRYADQRHYVVAAARLRALWQARIPELAVPPETVAGYFIGGPVHLRLAEIGLQVAATYSHGVTEPAPRKVTQCQLRNGSGVIMRCVERGEIPLRRRTLVPREEVMAAFATAPVLDADRFCSDIDGIAAQDPFDRDW